MLHRSNVGFQIVLAFCGLVFSAKNSSAQTLNIPPEMKALRGLAFSESRVPPALLPLFEELNRGSGFVKSVATDMQKLILLRAAGAVEPLSEHIRQMIAVNGHYAARVLVLTPFPDLIDTYETARVAWVTPYDERLLSENEILRTTFSQDYLHSVRYLWALRHALARYLATKNFELAPKELSELVKQQKESQDLQSREAGELEREFAFYRDDLYADFWESIRVFPDFAFQIKTDLYLNSDPVTGFLNMEFILDKFGAQLDEWSKNHELNLEQTLALSRLFRWVREDSGEDLPRRFFAWNQRKNNFFQKDETLRGLQQKIRDAQDFSALEQKLIDVSQLTLRERWDSKTDWLNAL